MNTVFTLSAVEQIRAASADPADKAELAHLVRALSAADSPDDLKLLGAISVSRDVFVIGRGRWRVVLTNEADHPDRTVIGSVFHVQEGDSAKAEGVVRDAPEVAG